MGGGGLRHLGFRGFRLGLSPVKVSGLGFGFRVIGLMVLSGKENGRMRRNLGL